MTSKALACALPAACAVLLAGGPVLADSVTEDLLQAAGWHVERTSDSQNGQTLRCELSVSGPDGTLSLARASTAAALEISALPHDAALLDAVFADNVTFKSAFVVDGAQVLAEWSTPGSPDLMLDEPARQEKLLSAMADGARMTLALDAPAATGEMRFSLKGSARAVEAYRTCLTGPQAGSADDARGRVTTDNRDFPAPAGWIIAGERLSAPGMAQYSTCNATVGMDPAAPFLLGLTVRAHGDRKVGAGSLGIQGNWLRPVLALPSGLRLQMFPEPDGMGGSVTFRSGQESAWRNFLDELAKGGTVSLTDDQTGRNYDLRLEGAGLAVASLRDCIAFIEQ